MKNGMLKVLLANQEHPGGLAPGHTIFHPDIDSSYTVLVVDDDEISLDVARELLQLIGVGQVHVALGGARALKQLRQLARVDMVVVDIYMPDMDGIEFISELAKCRYAGKVIMVSGVNGETLAMAQEIAQGQGIDVVAAMEKPLKKARLAQAMGFAPA